PVEGSSGHFGIPDSVNGGFHGQNVGMSAEAGDLADANRGDEGLMTEFLPRMDVGKVDFDGGNSDRSDGVPEGDAGVGIGGSVQNDYVGLALRFLNPGDQFAFRV